MSESNQTLFGFPVVITDAVPAGKVFLGRFPTWQDVLKYGSFDAAIEAQKEEWGIVATIENVETDNGQ